MSDEKTITFGLAEPKDSEDYKGSSQTVEVLTDMRQRCSRCKTMVLGEPLGMRVVDVVSSEDRSDAQRAVAVALYKASVATAIGVVAKDGAFDDLEWSTQSKWLREAADGYEAECYNLDAIGPGMAEKVREAGVTEAKKWRAYTDKRKLFRVDHVRFPPGWLHLSFEARGSKDGQPVRYGNVLVHVCPKCAPAIFDAANVDPMEPFGNGVCECDAYESSSR